MEQYAFDKLYKARQEIKKLKFTYPGFGKRENLVEWSPHISSSITVYSLRFFQA